MKLKYVLLILIIVPTIALSFFQLYNFNKIQSWENIIEKHLRKYPGMESQDIYHLVCEGVYGFNYVECSRNDIYKNLKKKYKDIYPDNSYEMLEQISPDNKYIRVNLRKYKFCNGDLYLLCEMMYQSQKKVNKSKIESSLLEINKTIKKGNLNFSRTKWLEYYHILETNNFPYPDYSEYFQEFFNPAYVVVDKEIWDKQTHGIYN